MSCGADETVLDAAFRQGYNLAYGCREGQCSACKCYLLEGAVDLERYSNSPLRTASGNGYALMCRAMPSQTSPSSCCTSPRQLPPRERDPRTEATVTEVTELTHDIVGVKLTVPEVLVAAGAVHRPPRPGRRRGAALALDRQPAGRRGDRADDQALPGGRLSGTLGNEIRVSDSVAFHRAVRGLSPAASEAPILMIAGGSAMAPVLGCCASWRPNGASARCVSTTAPASNATCSRWMRSPRWASGCPIFVSSPSPAGSCTRPSTRSSPRRRLPARAAADARSGRGDVDETRRRPGPDLPGQVHHLGRRADRRRPAASDEPAASAVSERDFGGSHPRPGGDPDEDVTVDTQPSTHRHRPEAGRCTSRTGAGPGTTPRATLRSSDWFAFRDPGEQWERPFYQAGAAVEQQIESAVRSASEQGLIEDIDPAWAEFLRGDLQVPAFLEHGLWFALATAARDCLSDTVATCVCLQAAMKQRSAQAIVLYAMDLEQRLHQDFPIAGARETFLRDTPWQPARRYLERLAATPDWAEVVFAANLCFEPVVATLVRRELRIPAAAAHGDTVTPVLARAKTQEWNGRDLDGGAESVPARRPRTLGSKIVRFSPAGCATGCPRRSPPPRAGPGGRADRARRGAGHRAGGRLRGRDAR